MLISVITVNYNNGTGLNKTLSSVAQQTSKDFEFVVIDGGSTDESVETIKSNKKISTWISEKDDGVYQAMNKGVKKATGKYVIFMNSGDVFYDDEVLNDFAEDLKEDYDLVYGNSLFYNDDGYLREDTPPEKLTFKFFRDAGINHQASFIKRRLFYDSFFYNEDYNICSDWDFFIRNICLNNISYMKKERFVVRYDWSGISAKPENYQTYLDERQATLVKYFSCFTESRVHEESVYDVRLNSINPKRIGQFIFLKDYKIAWKFLRGIINVFLLFIPKNKFKKFMNE